MFSRKRFLSRRPKLSIPHGGLPSSLSNGAGSAFEPVEVASPDAQKGASWTLDVQPLVERDYQLSFR